jgi:hypothetical protein
MGMRSRRSLVAVFASLLLIVGSAWPAAGQATTSTVAGAVRDAQGGVIPGATISLISESRGTTFTASSSETGDFVVPNIPGDTYTVRVEMDGFKTSERKGVSVSPGERAAVGTITIEVGSLEETVTVTGEAPLIQAQTGDRSFVVDTSQVESLPVANRNYASYAAMVPGVVSSMPGSFGIVRADGARTNYLLDGVATVDTGGNQQGLAINSDAIAEVRVISSAYQAEYGRTAGIQIVGVTKSGTNQFRGSVFDIVRKTAWNTNTWVNEKNGNAKPNADQTDWGVTIGGPVGKPGGKNKLFFFFSEQASPRSFGGVITRYRVPTALERRGDFSQSTDNTGALYPYIRDAATGLPCSAADTRGCFQDGGVLGRIPQDRLYGLGLKVLDRWPLPNVSGVNYNLETVQPNIPYNNWLHVARIDYQISDKLRFSAKYAGDFNKVYVYPGTIPGFDDKMTQYGADLLPSATVDYVISPTMVFEGTWGMTQGNERAGQGMMINNSTNKYLNGLGDLPTLYPDARVPVGSYQEKVMKGTNGGVPFYQNGRLALPPQFTWGTRIANPPVNTLYPGFVCWQRTQDVALSVTKLWGPHTFKFGLQTQDSLKVQNVGTQTRGVLPPEGRVNFGNDGNNPLDSGFGFANAALGIFTSYEQQNALIEGTLIYHNRDFYLQDNWRVNPKLTLDYGMRFTHHGPQYDKAGQASNFFPEKWQASQAPLLYQPGCAVAASPCPATSRVAIDPRSGNSLGIGSAGAIGTIVPNTGILMNGIIQQGKGINEANYTESFMSYGPRFGLAYDMKGDQTFVFRGSLGYFFDRVQGDSVFGQSGNPPTGEQSTVYYSTLQSLAAGGQVLHAPPAMLVYYYDAEIGSSLNWNGGVQMVLPWSSSLDVSYVGSHNFNSVSFGAVPNAMSTELSIDLNAPDMGTAYLPQYQDSTRSSAIPGGAAYTTDLLRPYRGIGAVNTTWPRFWTQYDSMQVAYNRRLRNGWSGSFSYTYGLRFEGNTWSPVHLVHNGGTVSIASYQKEKDEVMKNVGRRPHLIKANASWNMPQISGGDSSGSKVLAAVANGWQVAAVLTAGNTVPYDATFAYQGISNVNLTGSPNYTARVKVIGDTGSGCSSNQYKQFNPAAFQGPTYYSTGYESGNNILAGCWDKTVDLSLSRNIALGGHRQLQFRMDFFNLFNAVVYNARQTTIQYTTPAAPTTVTNNQYNADGSLNQARLTPANAGAGAATGAQAMRSLQAQLRFYF